MRNRLMAVLLIVLAMWSTGCLRVGGRTTTEEEPQVQVETQDDTWAYEETW